MAVAMGYLISYHYPEEYPQTPTEFAEWPTGETSSTRQMTSIYSKSLVFVIFPLLYFFGIIKHIWHPCGVSSRNNFPSRGLLPSGYALEQQSSLGEVIPAGHPTGMSYLYNNEPVFWKRMYVNVVDSIGVNNHSSNIFELLSFLWIILNIVRPCVHSKCRWDRAPVTQI